MKKLKVSRNATRLEKRVAKMINSKVENGYSLESILKDLFYGGCASGMIGELIYTYDCVRFYKLYRKDIDSLVYNLCNDTGCSPNQFSGWDKEDPFARGDNNQNILAWVGFEETARQLSHENGYEF